MSVFKVKFILADLRTDVGKSHLHNRDQPGREDLPTLCDESKPYWGSLAQDERDQWRDFSGEGTLNDEQESEAEEQENEVDEQENEPDEQENETNEQGNEPDE